MTAGVSAGGRVAAGFERVADEFERNLGEGGAAFAAIVDGEPAPDRNDEYCRSAMPGTEIIRWRNPSTSICTLTGCLGPRAAGV